MDESHMCEKGAGEIENSATSPTRPRARDIGIEIGVFRPGRSNAIIDVAGVGVGHCTLVSGDGKLVPGKGPVRTGVTVVVPHAGSLFEEKVPAAAFALNAFGKAIGLEQLNELGNLETPIALTNTLNAPLVADAIIEWSLGRNPDIGIATSTVNPVVGEVNDGFLNDIQGRHVRKEHVFEAIGRALEMAEAAAEAEAGAATGARVGVGTTTTASLAADGSSVVSGAPCSCACCMALASWRTRGRQGGAHRWNAWNSVYRMR
ncbi:MAG: P1 family peptidase [Bacillota bacterium]|nr:P1 family peptidase [Bacillota bacterium]